MHNCYSTICWKDCLFSTEFSCTFCQILIVQIIHGALFWFCFTDLCLFASYIPYTSLNIIWIHIYIYGASQMALGVKNPPANAEDARDSGSIPGSGRSHGGEHGNPLQCSCLENPMDGGAFRATVNRVANDTNWANSMYTYMTPYILHVDYCSFIAAWKSGENFQLQICYFPKLPVTFSQTANVDSLLFPHLFREQHFSVYETKSVGILRLHLTSVSIRGAFDVCFN